MLALVAKLIERFSLLLYRKDVGRNVVLKKSFSWSPLRGECSLVWSLFKSGCCISWILSRLGISIMRIMTTKRKI